ncbi:hypothetical protein L1987_24268 [Smallanthus sonchifolius]|uniref:Uncharacterized protein n=1 Tax=Smallanthus sonchifolius TaxID=185202 RepID=A0ACB9IJY4_9ASTR|nr:hypothetical protein L1987_24268 [Smallanthus sonchifolius]
MAGIVELLPVEYGYIILTIAAYYFLNLYMERSTRCSTRHSMPPKQIPRITNSSTVFSDPSRGHRNSLESLPMFFVLMVVGGLKHPVICTGLGLVYTVARFFYFTGYSSGDPKARLPIGGFNGFALLGLVIVNIRFGVSLLRA